MNDLISIVVPVYNVAYLLERCIKSILNQTYRNLEIILVDDGSTDESGKLCDHYSKNDGRINVIHKTNGGLSSARNAGTKISNGKYLLFVDSDDWIKPNMVEILYNQIIRTQADICVCGISPTDGNTVQHLEWFNKDLVLSKQKALDKLIKCELFTSHAWNKLYRTDIIIKFPFPEGKLYEDIYVMHNIFSECNSIAVVKDYLYFYYQRPNSITTVHNLKNRIAYVDAFKARYYDIKSNSKYEEILRGQIAVVEALVIIQSKISKGERKTFKNELMQIKKDLRKTNNLQVKKNATKQQYVYFCAAKYSPNLARLIYHIIEPMTVSFKIWKRGK